MQITHWIIRADQPYKGFTQSFLLPDGTIAYTSGMTPKAYAAAQGFPVKVITSEELDALDAEFTARLITEPSAETVEQFNYALEVLPPCRWALHRGVELFHVSERITQNLVHWHARIGARHFTCIDSANVALDDIAAKFAAAAKA